MKTELETNVFMAGPVYALDRLQHIWYQHRIHA
jgi:hypothetical protein